MKMHVLAGMALVAVGCASHPAPTDQVASSLAAVRGAEEAGARDVPEAALHMKLAEEQIAQAKRLMEDDDNRRAEDLAMRAYQDAELALAIARENAAKKRLDQFASSAGSSGGEQMPAPASTMQPTTTPARPARSTATP
jgi:pyridoxal biosynthesis lyase PdxS